MSPPTVPAAQLLRPGGHDAVGRLLERDHTQAVAEHGIFGTPTLVFADGASAYVRLAEDVGAGESLEVFERLVAVAASEPRILEIKRPRKPALSL